MLVRLFLELEPGVHVLACYKRQQGSDHRARRVDEGDPGGQDLSEIGIWQRTGLGQTTDKVESTVGPLEDLVTGLNEEFWSSGSGH